MEVVTVFAPDSLFRLRKGTSVVSFLKLFHMQEWMRAQYKLVKEVLTMDPQTFTLPEFESVRSRRCQCG